MKATIEIILAHVAAIGITFTNAEQPLKILSLLCAIGFTIYRFRNEYIDRKNRTGPNQIVVNKPHLNGNTKKEEKKK